MRQVREAAVTRRRCRTCKRPSQVVGVELCPEHFRKEWPQLLAWEPPARVDAGKGLRESMPLLPVDELMAMGRWMRRRLKGQL